VNEAAHRVRGDDAQQPQHQQDDENCPKHSGSPSLVVVGMGMAPIPVIGLFSLAGLGEFMGFFVIVGQVDPPGIVLAIVPVVVVLVVGIIDSDLDAVVIRCGGGQSRQGRCDSGGQEKRNDITMCKTHMVFSGETLRFQRWNGGKRR
jgi:hypothetical protein